MGAVTVKVDASGRLVIPKDMRVELGIPDGGELRLSVEDGELRASTRLAALRRIQRELRGTVPPGVSVVDELIAERRAEAARDLAEDRAWEEERRRRSGKTPPA
jgi:AbrB family looped-hinge helix DNA binding protein